MSYAYLGPEGTFTQAALRRLAPAGRQAVPFPTVAAALDSVRRGESEAAVVPLENSVRGVVPATMDQLVSAGLSIDAEVEVPVTFALMARPGVTLADLTQVSSHPHALAQCTGWLGAELPGVTTLTADSTAGAARAVAASGEQGIAAIAAPLAAELYGLRVLADGIGATEEAVTRFVSVTRAAVGRHQGLCGPRRCRTSLLVSVADHGPDRLAEVFDAFAARGVRVAWLQSWPTGEGLGSYRYFIDLDGHIDEEPLAAAVWALAELGHHTRHLGSYPKGADALHALRS